MSIAHSQSSHAPLLQNADSHIVIRKFDLFIFERVVALLEFRIFHRKVCTHKFSYILYGSYKIYFSKVKEWWERRYLCVVNLINP
jgi:hypothetical protein